nr:non-structural maintenance of chromosomes element 3 like [Quercus suber]
MPQLASRKRHSTTDHDQDDEDVSSPEPATQRRRHETPEDNGNASFTQGDVSEDQMVKKMIRLALACEYHRRPIRRADIAEKVLGAEGRKFRQVFNQAQLQLRDVFGMEMVELPARDRLTLQQRRGAAAAKSATQTKTVTSWILVSILPAQFRDPAIVPPSAVPTSAEESKYTALSTLIVSLISLSGGTLPDAKMERYLRRLNIQDNTPLADSELAKTEKLFKKLERDGYVMKTKESSGTGEEDVYWTVGPRGKMEVGDEGVKTLVRTVYGEQTNDEECEDLERRLERTLGVAERAEKSHTGLPEPKKRGRKPRRDAEDEEQGEEEEEDEMHSAFYVLYWRAHARAFASPGRCPLRIVISGVVLSLPQTTLAF